MIVETYFQEDMRETFSEANEWKEKVEELGLQGQVDMVGKAKSPIPYLRMSDELLAIFETLCPDKTDILQFDRETIPLEALKDVGLCHTEQYFEKLEVWSSHIDSDPIIVGVNNADSYSTRERFLVCRWGPEKVSFDELKEKAKKRWTENAKATLKASIDSLESKLASIESLAVHYFNGKHVYIPDVS